MKRKIFNIVIISVLVIQITLISACNSIHNEYVQEKSTVTVLYTNDIHAFLNNDNSEEGGISYAELSQMKKDAGENVLLVDAGDHIQGSVYGAMDQGQTVVELMNGIYDLATLGNHEFDYGIKRTLSIVEEAAYPYISCNFVHCESKETVLTPYIMLSAGNAKLGFVGITTPETVTSTAPSYFQNEKGEYIYDFLSGDKLYQSVQSSIEALENKGADYIIALGHVGVDEGSEITSRSIIENVEGLDAFIDGHSHTEIEGELIRDKSGNNVVLTQTGHYFGGVGKMTIGKDGIKTEIVREYKTQDKNILDLKNKWVNDVEQMLGENVGFLPNKLDTNDKNGDRIVRVNSANIGDFIADAFYYYVNEVSQINCDVAIINGGGIRADINSGRITYKDLKSATPFGNMLCAIELKGQQILDMLEWGARSTVGEAGLNEEGAFLHTAGLTYRVNTAVKSSVQQDSQSLWNGAPTGKYRVSDVKIYDKSTKSYVDLDVEKTYCVAGADFTLINKGDGFNMISGKTVKDYIAEDYMALAAYALAFKDSDNDNLSDIISVNSPLKAYENYGINYETPEGNGRIEVK